MKQAVAKPWMSESGGGIAREELYEVLCKRTNLESLLLAFQELWRCFSRRTGAVKITVLSHSDLLPCSMGRAVQISGTYYCRVQKAACDTMSYA